MDIQTLYQETIAFAAKKHSDINQLVPGTDLPYVVHVSNVSMEILTMPNIEGFDKDYAVQLALLHDTLEDTETSISELEETFGIDVANGVQALTKNIDLPKEEQMQDSLNRIKKMNREVSAVKLADRITNLQKPPAHWDIVKKFTYCKEAGLILRELKDGSQFLAERLKRKITDYFTELILPNDVFQQMHPIREMLDAMTDEEFRSLPLKIKGTYLAQTAVDNLNNPENHGKST